jgi:hypothetical protein
MGIGSKRIGADSNVAAHRGPVKMKAAAAAAAAAKREAIKNRHWLAGWRQKIGGGASALKAKANRHKASEKHRKRQVSASGMKWRNWQSVMAEKAAAK